MPRRKKLPELPTFPRFVFEARSRLPTIERLATIKTVNPYFEEEDIANLWDCKRRAQQIITAVSMYGEKGITTMLDNFKKRMLEAGWSKDAIGDMIDGIYGASGAATEKFLEIGRYVEPPPVEEANN